jgi:hypothetical protein
MSQYWDNGNTGHKLAFLKSEYHAIMSKYLEEASILKQVYRVLGDIEYLAGCTLAEVGESPVWTSGVKAQRRTEQTVAKF